MAYLKSRKLTAILLASLMVLIFLFSLSFIVGEHEHECLGDTCEICEVIQVAEKNLGGDDKNTPTVTVFNQDDLSFLCSQIISVEKEVVENDTPITLFDVLLA